MSLAIQLRKMRMFRDWLDYQRAYEDRDEEAEMWDEFVQQWETDKALNRLAETFESHEHGENVMHCPICDYHCEIDDDGTADCDPCVIRWTVVDTGTFKYLDAEEEEMPWTPAERPRTKFHFPDGSTLEIYTNYTIEEHRKLARPYNEHYDYLKYLETTSDSRIKTFKEWMLTQMDWGAEDYGVENVWMSESFRDWADDELRTHGENVSFEKWSQEEFEDEPAHRHADGQLSFVRWAKDEMNEEHHNAEEFCAECGCSHKDAESFSAETANGNQVFNSCWKCGSGQHLHQISRYPASPDEIAGVGGDPEQASDNWLSGRPVQR